MRSSADRLGDPVAIGFCEVAADQRNLGEDGTHQLRCRQCRGGHAPDRLMRSGPGAFGLSLQLAAVGIVALVARTASST
jgi:hypothetical protein